MIVASNIRYDDLRLDASSIKVLDDGSILVTGALTHTGLFPYRNPDGTARVEYRPEEEVMSGDSLNSFAHATVTVGHPGRQVSASTWRKDAIGHVVGTPRKDGSHVLADLLIRDADAIGRIKGGDLRRISCGYLVDYDPTPGVTAKGERYDGVQRKIRGNHVALLPKDKAPRGGDSCSLRLDATGDEVFELKSYMPDTNPLQERVDALEAELATLRKADVESLRAQITVLQSELTKVRQDSTEAVQKAAVIPQERIDALVADRIAVLALAKDSDVKPEGTNVAIKRAIVVKRTPELAERADSLSEETLDTLLAVYKAQPHPSMVAAVAVHAPPPAREDAAPAVKSISQIRADALAKTHSAWKKSHGVLGADK